MGLLMRQALLDALEARYEAEVAEAHAIIKIFLENPVGIGEHPQHLDELDKQFEKIANAEEKLEALKSFQHRKEGNVMEDMTFVEKIRKIIKMRHDDMVSAMASGGVDNMEKYNYMLGQIRTYQYLSQEISSLLNKKEQYEQDGTVIDINSKPKN